MECTSASILSTSLLVFHHTTQLLGRDISTRWRAYWCNHHYGVIKVSYITLCAHWTNQGPGAIVRRSNQAALQTGTLWAHREMFFMMCLWNTRAPLCLLTLQGVLHMFRMVCAVDITSSISQQTHTHTHTYLLAFGPSVRR